MYYNQAQGQGQDESEFVMQTQGSTNQIDRINLLIAIKQILDDQPHQNVASIISFQQIANNMIISQNETCDYTLEEYFRVRQSYWFSKEEIYNIIGQIVQGYMHLKKLRIVHRDLNPRTILVKRVVESNNVIIKISDFEVASYNQPRMNELIGTPFYQAPEIGQNPDYDDQCDVYSLGLILFQMCFKNQYHINPITQNELYKFNQQLKYNKFRAPDQSIDPAFKQLLEKMIVYDPKDRINWSALAGMQVLQPNFLVYQNNNNTRQYYIDFQKSLGKGNQGCTFLTYDLLNKNTEYCTKQIDSNNIEGQRELEAYKIIKENPYCENIIKIEDIKEDQPFTYLIMEKCDKNIEQYFRERCFNLSQQEVFDILQQIVTGYLHILKFNIIHRDLKPQNILLKYNTQTNKPILKIIDFGVGKVLQQSKEMTTTFAGTPIYTAPEIIFAQNYNNKCDMFSLGVMLHQLVYEGANYFHTQPNSIEDLQRILQNIKQTPVQCKKPYKNFSNNFLQLIDKMLKFEQNERIDWETLNQSLKDIMQPKIKIVSIINSNQGQESQNLQQQQSQQQQQQQQFQQQQQIIEQQQQQQQQIQYQQQQFQQQQQQQQQIQQQQQQCQQLPSYQASQQQQNFLPQQQQQYQSYQQQQEQLFQQQQQNEKQSLQQQQQQQFFQQQQSSQQQQQQFQQQQIGQPLQNFSLATNNQQQLQFTPPIINNIMQNQQQILNQSPNFKKFQTDNLVPKSALRTTTIPTPSQPPQQNGFNQAQQPNFLKQPQLSFNPITQQEKIKPSPEPTNTSNKPISFEQKSQNSIVPQRLNTQQPPQAQAQAQRQTLASNDLKKNQPQSFQPQLNINPVIANQKVQSLAPQQPLNQFPTTTHQVLIGRATISHNTSQNTTQDLNKFTPQPPTNIFVPKQSQPKEMQQFCDFFKNAASCFKSKLNYLNSQPAYLGFYLCISYYYKEIKKHLKIDKFNEDREEKEINQEIENAKKMIEMVDTKNGRLGDLKKLVQQLNKPQSLTEIQTAFQEFYQKNKDILSDQNNKIKEIQELNKVIQEMQLQSNALCQNRQFMDNQNQKIQFNKALKSNN